MSYVGIDTQGAQALGQALQESAGQVDGLLRHVAVALDLANLPSEVPAQLGLVQDHFATLATGVADKATLAEQVRQIIRRPQLAASIASTIVPSRFELTPGTGGGAFATVAVGGSSMLASSGDAGSAPFPPPMRLGGPVDTTVQSETVVEGATALASIATVSLAASTRGLGIPAANESTVLGTTGLDAFGGVGGMSQLLASVNWSPDFQAAISGLPTSMIGRPGDGATLGPGLAGVTPTADSTTRPRIVIAVIGNSYTSGEGGDLNTYETVDGVIHPAHRSSQAAAMQVIDRLRLQYPDADFEVRFVAVSGATPDSMYEFTQVGTVFQGRPQVDAAGAQVNVRRGDALSMADIVILGEGGNPHFNGLVREVLGWGDSATPENEARWLGLLTDPAFRTTQMRLHDEILSRMNPNGSLIVVGYPRVLPDEVPDDWWDPTSPSWAPWTGSGLYTAEARMVNRFASELNSQLGGAADMSRSLWSTRSVTFINPYDAFAANLMFSANPAIHGADWNPWTGTDRSYHPNPLGYRLLADLYQPIIDQAVQAAIALQRPPAPDGAQPGRRGDLEVPPGVMLADGSSVVGTQSYVDANWAAYVAENQANMPGFTTAGSLILGVPGFDASTFTWNAAAAQTTGYTWTAAGAETTGSTWTPPAIDETTFTWESAEAAIDTDAYDW